MHSRSIIFKTGTYKYGQYQQTKNHTMKAKNNIILRTTETRLITKMIWNHVLNEDKLVN